jgi:hypothetical protein
MENDPSTEKLEALQRERETAERERAENSHDEQEFAEHNRRADKAGYLRRKLEERAESEREATERDSDG